MSYNQVVRIEKRLAEFATASNENIKQKKFKSIRRTISTVINRINKEQIELENIINNKNKYNNAVSESKSEEYKEAKRRDLANTTSEEKNLRLKMKDSLLTGYEVIIKIREAITKEGIDYNFLVQTGKNSFSSARSSLGFKELDKMVSLENVSSGKYELRFKNLTGFIEQQENVVNYQYFVEANPSTAFSAFYRFFTDERLHKKYKLNNFGTFSQAYHYWYYAHGNKEIPSNEDILESFRYAKSGGGSTGAFYRGGDTRQNGYDISEKAQSLSSSGTPGRPSLTNLSAIRNGLLEIREGIDYFIQNKDLTKLEKSFSSDRLGQQVLEGAKKTATEEARDFF